MMTIEEHNARCGCTPAEPCDSLAAILQRQHHDGGLFRLTDPGRHPRAWIRG